MFKILIPLAMAIASWGGYHLPLPGIYPVGHELVITSDRYCDYRAVAPVEDVEYTTRKIDNYRTGITFQEQGLVTALKTFCLHSIYEDAPEFVPVDWLIRLNSPTPVGRSD